MVAIDQLVFGALIAALALIGLWRLSGVIKAVMALWRRPQATETDISTEETVSVTGEAFVEESAMATDRLFNDDSRDIGSYVWRATFTKGGNYTYDFDRGEFRKVRRSFASGIETGRFGVLIGNRHVYVDPSWLCQAYDSKPLSEVTIGEHRSNISLPLRLSQQLFDSPYLNLTTAGECQSGKLSDVLDVQLNDNRTDEFIIDGRGIPAGEQLFVSGTVRVKDGRLTLVGTEDAPLLISNTGRKGLRRRLVWSILKKTLLVSLVIGLGVLFLS